MRGGDDNGEAASAAGLSSTADAMRIGHYMRKMFEPGGIASYIRRVSAGLRGRGCEVVYFDRTPAVSTTAVIEKIRL